MPLEIIQPPGTTDWYWSFTKLAKYLECGEQFRLRYWEKEKEPPSVPAVVGRAFHKAVEEFEQDEFPTMLLRDLVREKVRAVDGFFNLRHYGSKDAAWWLKEGIPLLCRNYEKYRQREDMAGIEPWYYEGEVVARPWDDLPAIHGYVDRIALDSQDRLFLTDWKTGKLRSHHALQLELYTFLWNESHPDMRAEWANAVSVSGTKPTVLGPVIPVLTKDDWRRVLEPLARGVFPFNGLMSGACDSCAFRGKCLPAQVGEISVFH